MATQATSADHCRRSAMTTVTATRTGQSTAVPKPTLSASQTATSGSHRADTISSRN